MSCGVLLVLMAIGNFVNTVETLMAKSRFKAKMKRSKSKQELSWISLPELIGDHLRKKGFVGSQFLEFLFFLLLFDSSLWLWLHSYHIFSSMHTKCNGFIRVPNFLIYLWHLQKHQLLQMLFGYLAEQASHASSKAIQRWGWLNMEKNMVTTQAKWCYLIVIFPSSINLSIEPLPISEISLSQEGDKKVLRTSRHHSLTLKSSSCWWTMTADLLTKMKKKRVRDYFYLTRAQCILPHNIINCAQEKANHPWPFRSLKAFFTLISRPTRKKSITYPPDLFTLFTSGPSESWEIPCHTASR